MIPNIRKFGGQLLMLVTLCLGLVTAPLILFTGCGSVPPQNTITNVEKTTVNLVDDAMQGWHDWVADSSHHVTQAQIDTVHSAYDKYYTAQLVARATLEKWVSSGQPADQSGVTLANQAVSDAAHSLIDTVVQLTTKH